MTPKVKQNDIYNLKREDQSDEQTEQTEDNLEYIFEIVELFTRVTDKPDDRFFRLLNFIKNTNDAQTIIKAFTNTKKTVLDGSQTVSLSVIETVRFASYAQKTLVDLVKKLDVSEPKEDNSDEFIDNILAGKLVKYDNIILLIFNHSGREMFLNKIINSTNLSKINAIFVKIYNYRQTKLAQTRGLLHHICNQFSL